MIKKIEASGKKLVIPGTITVDGTGYAVTTIAKGAFKGESEITEITIGENVTTVKAGLRLSDDDLMTEGRFICI